ncbi:RNA polymerase III RPC4-domain-containing protein [Abortiporus biennis]|nr:RNA polymerase III RPC4-domain-containing protein [Abortiporus biennis]
MAEPSGSGSGQGTPKAIASLAKKQSDVTRMGTQKLKFVPTLPARRKKEDVKQEEAPAPSTTDRGRGRGRGGDRGRGRGRGGEGRGGSTRAPPVVEMTASGPFAMGPALAGSSARRTAPKSNFAPIVPQGPSGSARLGAGLTQTTAPTLGGVKRENDLTNLKKVDKDEDEGEVYSDPDEGVEIIDMENVRTMDWMAPESLRREKEGTKKKKLKKEEGEKDVKGKAKAEAMEIDEEPHVAEEVNLANALDLSESEDEEELEDIIQDFATYADLEADSPIRQERLYFFQFPEPFPKFVSNSTSVVGVDDSPEDGTKKVTFAEDTKPPAAAATPTGTPAPTQIKKEPSEGQQKTDGVIGQLEVYRSGAVKMRVGNGIVYDIVSATQPSFLQHAVYMDPENKRLCVLGEVNRRFVASPDINALLDAMEIAERPPGPPELEIEGLIQMDTT